MIHPLSLTSKSLPPRDNPGAHYCRPVLAIFREPVPSTTEEIFGLYSAVVSCAGGIENALRLVQKRNAKPVNAFYEPDVAAARIFQQKNEPGFTLINTLQGTRLLLPYGLGFGGNGLSSQGESFARDPESIFVKPRGDIKRCVTFKLPS